MIPNFSLCLNAKHACAEEFGEMSLTPAQGSPRPRSNFHSHFHLAITQPSSERRGKRRAEIFQEQTVVNIPLCNLHYIITTITLYKSVSIAFILSGIVYQTLHGRPNVEPNYHVGCNNNKKSIENNDITTKSVYRLLDFYQGVTEMQEKM